MQAYAERVLWLERQLGPAMYVVQLPPPARGYFGVNGGGQIAERDFDTPRVLGWKGPLDASIAASPTRISLTRLMAREGSPFFPSLERWVYPVVRENSPETDFPAFCAFAAFWDLHVADSDLQHVIHGKEIVALQLLLARLGRKLLMFDWHHYNAARDARLGLFRGEIAWEGFVQRGRFTAFEFLETRHPGGLPGMTVDAHGHLNAEGHRLLAEAFVLPALRLTLDAEQRQELAT